MIVICIGMFMTNLDVSIVNIALPTISDYFDVDLGVASWTVIVYTLVLSSFLLTFGRMGDVYGFKRIFLIGMALFTLGSFLNSISGSIVELLVFRAIQAAGGGMMSSIAYAMTSHYLPNESRGIGLGYMSVMMAVGLALGPVIGGYLTEYLNWQSIFLINIPIGIVGLAMAVKFVPDSSPVGGQRINYVSSGIIFVAMFSMILGLNLGNSMGWTSPWLILTFVVGIIALMLFIRYERSVDNPLIEPKLIANRDVLKASLSSLFVMGAFAGAFVLLPYYFEYTRGLSTETTGLVLMVASIPVMVIGPLVGKISKSAGLRFISAVGAGVAAGSFAIMMMYDVDSGWIMILVGLAIFGIGEGLYMAPNTNYIFTMVTKEYEGITSGLSSTFKNIGSSFGIAAMESVFTASIVGSDLVPGFRVAFILGGVLSLLAAVMMLVTRNGSKKVGENGAGEGI